MADKTKWWTELGQRWGKNRMVLIGLGLAGVMLLILPGSCGDGGRPPVSGGDQLQESNYRAKLQAELETILAGIEGVGRVTVMLTLEDEQEVIYAINEEERKRSTQEDDGQGGTRETIEFDRRGQLVIVRSGGQEQPVIIKILKPRVRGVLIVATGADSPQVRQSIIQAVQAVLDVSAYRISVQKGK